VTIATLDGVLAGMIPPQFFAKAVTPTLVAGRPTSLWALAGMPGAGAFDNTLNGVVLSSSSAIPNGAIPHTNPGAGNSYLARLEAAATQAGTLLLLDRLWHNGNIVATTTTAQNITSPTFPARDMDGATAGRGVLLAAEVSAVMGAATPTITASYTNSAAASGKSAVNILGTASAAPAGATYFLSLAAGDVGVKSVQSVTLNVSWVSGTLNLVAYRLLAALELPLAGVPNAIDALTAGFPRLFDGVVPWLVFIPSTTTASNIVGTYGETQG
jgi:hypothetical protein